MKQIKWVQISVLLLSVSVLYFCSANPLDPDMESSTALQKGIPTDQISWAEWNPEVTAALAEAQSGDLAKRTGRKGYASKTIRSDVGGQVGGEKTFMNMVEVPQDAFEENRLRISVRVLNFDASGQTAAGVEFLPSRNYDADMRITLSWGFLNIEGNAWEELNLQPYYSEDGGDNWFPVDEYVVDHVAKTINFGIGHFTQYAWALGEDED